MLALAASLDDCQDFEPGDIVWAKLTGYAMWPAVVLDESLASNCKGLKTIVGGRSVPVQFFGTHDFARYLSEHKLPLEMLELQKRCTADDCNNVSGEEGGCTDSGNVIFSTPPQEHYFDCPYQLSSERVGQTYLDAMALELFGTLQRWKQGQLLLFSALEQLVLL